MVQQVIMLLFDRGINTEIFYGIKNAAYLVSQSTHVIQKLTLKVAIMYHTLFTSYKEYFISSIYLCITGVRCGV